MKFVVYVIKTYLMITVRLPANYAGDIYSAQVCAQIWGHSQFPDSHDPMGRLSDTIGEISGAGASRALRGTWA